MTAPPERTDPFAVDADPRWSLRVDGWTSTAEPGIEGALALVNGYAGTRAALEEGSAVSTPATFLNGVFDAASHAAAQAAITPDRQVIAAPTAELVVAPDWSKLRVLVQGEPLTVETATVFGHRRTLDLRRGVLVREWRLRMGGVRHLVDHRTRPLEGGMLLETVTAQRRIGICLASSITLATDDADGVQGENDLHERALIWRCRFDVSPGRTLRLDKLVTVFTGRDDPDPAGRAAERLHEVATVGLPAVLERSAAAWADRWATADVEVAGDEELQRRVRFASYHLIGCANPDDRRAAPGARSLTGERYKGHVFWDNETFVLPFFVYTHPPTARAILGYRYLTLPAARENARARGWRGAAYAWESADTGQDVTPAYYFTAAGERKDTRTGEEEHHLNADIGFAVWQYWQATGDERYLLEEGAEILVELARFWASRAERGADGRWHVRRVIGPDEYHEGVDDNAYTNQLAAWLLGRAAELAAWLAERHPDRWRSLAIAIDLDDGEPAGWRAVAEGLVDGVDPKTGLIEQHHGFHQLEELDLAPFQARTTTMDVALGWERLGRLKLLKQADVVMLLALLGERYPGVVQEANFGYYEPLTVHDSSLSPPMHALVAARLGELDTAGRYLEQASELDLDFEHGTTAAGGVHIATLGGVWQALALGFGGMTVADGDPRFAPHVPASWGSLRFRVRWRGAVLEVVATGGTATVTGRS